MAFSSERGGKLDKPKPRVVAKGFLQVASFNYIETFSHVMKFGTIRIIITISIAFKWPLRKIDVNNLFLNGTITKEVYMHQMVGFVDKEYATRVCKLQISLYELKQVPRAWFEKLSGTLIKFGFFQSKVDDLLFILV